MWSRSALNDSLSAISEQIGGKFATISQNVNKSLLSGSEDLDRKETTRRHLEAEVLLLRRELSLRDAPELSEVVLDDTRDDSDARDDSLDAISREARRLVSLDAELEKTSRDRDHWQRLLEIENERHLELTSSLEKIIQIKDSLKERNSELEKRVKEFEEKAEEKAEPLVTSSLVREEPEGQSREVQEWEREKSVKNEENLKLKEELFRLRKHLVSIEENFTQEVVASAEKEREIRTRNECLEQQLREMREKDSAFDNTLRSARTERDIARNECSRLEDRVQQCAASVANLQLVIEQIQRENERNNSDAERRHGVELLVERKRVDDALEALRRAEAREAEAREALGAAARLTTLLDENERKNETLKQFGNFLVVRMTSDCWATCGLISFGNSGQLLSRDSRVSFGIRTKTRRNRKDCCIVVSGVSITSGTGLEFESTQQKETRIASLEKSVDAWKVSSEGKVDKQVVKSLLCGYFCAKDEQKPEVQRLLARVLDFNQQEMDRCGIHIGRARPSETSDSLSQKFVQFLEKESQKPKTEKNAEIARNLSKTLIQSSQRNPFLTQTQTPSVGLSSQSQSAIGSRHSSANSSTDNLLLAPAVTPLLIVSTNTHLNPQ
ncbi:unnamed protein product [Medioppia subpectinata]|uniref:GRIP domain-containing protein n=1 Tax=Medioppia subpectinata TaxID=1979941 RepID=A0A7R9KBZ5_9ACAR|nr:unnamed protein product [Medioppia subpectinata]CAG2100507.1 unnamed protein product [Medioppia subpectinata]